MNIYIDIGHGETGTDSGASAVSGPTTYYENERNLRIAKACAGVLEDAGHTVILSRTSNVNTGSMINTYNRADSNIINSATIARQNDFDCMLSIHCNDYSDNSARGYVLIAKKDELSAKLCDAIAYGFDNCYTGTKIPKNRISDEYTRYGILRLHNKPGVLIECGFLSNTKDLHEILCNYNRIGDAIGEGIAHAFPVTNNNAVIDALNKCYTALDELRSIING